MNPPLSILVLAAGMGTRMKSSLPKVLHKVGGVPMVFRVLKTCFELRPKKIAVVIGCQAEEVVSSIQNSISELRSPAVNSNQIEFVRQKSPQGSGHAVKVASPWIEKNLNSDVLILCGDTPLLTVPTLRKLLVQHRNQENDLTACSMRLNEPFGYGRISRDAGGQVQKIVEEKDASPAEKKIEEVNTGIYCFQARKLLEALRHLRNNNAKKEYYLTDTIEHFYENRYSIGCFQLGTYSHYEALGINTRTGLAVAEKILQEKILKRWMDAGVTILNPSCTYIGENVKIGRDTEILPGTMLTGKTKIGSGCKIGPNSYIEDSQVGNEVVVRASFVYGSKIGDQVKIGPFSHLRPETIVESGARIGNFTEVKKSRIGKRTKVSHLAYVGDALLGEDINVGAGAITCNFDGKHKHKTVIGSKSFIGSNVNLVAPVKIGPRTIVGAGSTITKDVPSDSLAIERAQPVVKPGWTKGKIE